MAPERTNEIAFLISEQNKKKYGKILNKELTEKYYIN